MSMLKDAVAAAVQSAAANPSIPLDPAAAPQVVAAVTAALPSSAAMEPLGPQLARYAISILGSVLVGHGLVAESDWPVIAGAILALGPPVYRTITTMLARRKAGS
ncbi:Pam3-gp28 family putative phage holin [Xanthobacter sediminis]